MNVLPAQSCGLLLLLVVALLAPTPGECVVTLAFQDMSQYETEVLHKPVNSSANTTTSVAVCCMLRPEVALPNTDLERTFIDGPYTFLTLKTSTHEAITLGIKSFSLWLFFGYGYNRGPADEYQLDAEVKPDAWNSLCLGLRPTGNPETLQVWASLEERYLDLPQVVIPARLSLGVRIQLGYIYRYVSFTGLITAVTLMWGDDAVPTNCSTGVADNALTHEKVGSAASYSVLDLLAEEVCPRAQHTVLLEGPLGYADYDLMCQTLGGHIPTTEEAEEVGRAVMESQNVISEERCFSWVSGKDEDTLGPNAPCFALLKNGSVEKTPCNTELQFTWCMVPSALRYTLYGTVTGFDRHYFLRTLPNGYFYFDGNETSYISKERSGWVLRSNQHLHKLVQNAWVMGRRPWHSPHFSVSLTFTVCSVLQYSTDNGECLPRSQRCDGSVDSPDKSDERNCSVQVFSKTGGYDASVSPFSEYNPGEIDVEISSLNIEKIRTVDDMITMELHVRLSWNVPNLKMWTRSDWIYFPCQDLWTPVLRHIALDTEEPRHAIEPNTASCKGVSSRFVETADFNDPFMGKVADGTVVKFATFTASFPCHLVLVRYPFGKSVCNVTIGLFENLKTWKEPALTIYLRESQLPYKGDRNLLDYRLDNILMEEHGSSFSLLFYLSGQPEYHLLNSFLPSSLVFLICYSSLWFPTAEFTDRVMVSLTSLLVLMTLFSVPADSYIKSPSYRLLSMWFVVLIVLCFAVVVCNVGVNVLRRSRIKVRHDQESATESTERVNTVCRVLLLLCFASLLVTYFLLGCEVL